MADTKQQWYKDAKYGLFIHWGLYSILAGEWKDPKTGEVTKTDRIAEWIENNLNIDKEDSGSSDRNGFLQNKLRDLPEPVKLP